MQMRYKWVSNWSYYWFRLKQLSNIIPFLSSNKSTSSTSSTFQLKRTNWLFSFVVVVVVVVVGGGGGGGGGGGSDGGGVVVVEKSNHL